MRKIAENKSRADYFKERRKDSKAFYVEIEKEKMEKFEKKLASQNQTKKEWLNEMIEEELKFDTIRERECPYCKYVENIDISDIANISSDERGMGPETLYEVDEEVYCEKCGKVYRFKGYISEYPMLVLNHEAFECLKLEDDEDDEEDDIF